MATKKRYTMGLGGDYVAVYPLQQLVNGPVSCVGRGVEVGLDRVYWLNRGG